MGLWKRIEQAVWTGQVLRDYGSLSEGRRGPVKVTVSALRTWKSNQDRFIIKSSYVSFFAASVHYMEFDRDAALKLKAALDDAVDQMTGVPTGGSTGG